MAPLPLILTGPLSAGQAIIISANNGTLSITRPLLPPRPGLKPKQTNRSDGIFGRRLISRENE
jgi:hypothetical protein